MCCCHCHCESRGCRKQDAFLLCQTAVQPLYTRVRVLSSAASNVNTPVRGVRMLLGAPLACLMSLHSNIYRCTTIGPMRQSGITRQPASQCNAWTIFSSQNELEHMSVHVHDMDCPLSAFQHWVCSTSGTTLGRARGKIRSGSFPGCCWRNLHLRCACTRNVCVLVHCVDGALA